MFSEIGKSGDKYLDCVKKVLPSLNKNNEKINSVALGVIFLCFVAIAAVCSALDGGLIHSLNSFSYSAIMALVGMGGAAIAGAMLVKNALKYLHDAFAPQAEEEDFLNIRSLTEDPSVRYAAYEPAPVENENKKDFFNFLPSGGLDVTRGYASSCAWDVREEGQKGSFVHAEPGLGFGFALDGPPEKHDLLRKCAEQFVATLKNELSQQEFNSFKEAEDYLNRKCLDLASQIDSLKIEEKPALNLSLILKIDGVKYLMTTLYGDSRVGINGVRMDDDKRTTFVRSGIGTKVKTDKAEGYKLTDVHCYQLDRHDYVLSIVNKRCQFSFVI